MTPFELQPLLAHESATLAPLREEHFEALYAVASDPLVWEQHPNRDRWQREVFRVFFEGALASGGAFQILDTRGRVAGSTRFYDHDPAEQLIYIGYTFYARNHWGTGINAAVKKLMLDHAFRFVDRVRFSIGATNLRSQIAIGRIGATKIAEADVAYVGEPSKPNFIYEITKPDWQTRARR